MAGRKSAAGAGSTSAKALADIVRGQAVLAEQMKSHMGVVLEAVSGLSQQMDAMQLRMEASEARLSERISALESAVRQNSIDIRKNSEDIRKNSQDIAELREEVARLRHDFDRREERGAVAALERRVAVIEARLGIASP
jgi:TolA-binding protein